MKKKLIRISALRQCDRNKYMSVWSAQRKEYIHTYHDDAGNIMYDENEYQAWHKTSHGGRKRKNRPLTEYRIDEILKMGYHQVFEKNEQSSRVFTRESVERLVDAIIKLKNSEVYNK